LVVQAVGTQYKIYSIEKWTSASIASLLCVALVLFMLFVFVAYSGVTMSIDYMSNMVGIL